VHTEDLARAHQAALENMQPGAGRTFNVGSGRGATVLEVLRACEEVVGRPIPHSIAGRRPGDPAVLIASSERLMRELGWEPRFAEIRDIVATAWAWCQSHPHGYASRT
jgi:UDP-glucose 4-epimerase